MMKLTREVFVIVLLLCVFTNIGFSKEISRSVVLDDNIGFVLSWKFNGTSQRDDITFTIEANLRGWMAIGFSPGGNMTGSDIIVSWIDSKGQPFLLDMHALGYQTPIKDYQQDVILLNASRATDKTTLVFKRKINTCDKEEDLIISADTMHVIYAYGVNAPHNNEFDASDQHTVITRGVKSLYILDPPVPQLPVDGNLKKHDFKVKNFDIPFDASFRYCSLRKGPELTQKHHIISVEPLFASEESKKYIYHMILNSCTNVTESDFRMDNQTIHDGNCFSQPMSSYLQFCKSVVFTWTRGSGAFHFPDNVGYSIGPGNEYFLTQIVYSNPTHKREVSDSSGLMITYTPTLRSFDAGTIKVGSLRGGFAPPGAEGFRVVGYCHNNCTKEWIPSKGIEVFSTIFTAHDDATSVQLDWYRDDKQKGIFAKDLNYNSSFQVNRLFYDVKTLLPGDTLKLTCALNTKALKAVVHGGDTSARDMCAAYIMYYPIQNIYQCETVPEFCTDGNNTLYTSLYVTPYRQDSNAIDIGVSLSNVSWSEELMMKAQNAVDTALQNIVCESSKTLSYRSNTKLVNVLSFNHIISSHSEDICPATDGRTTTQMPSRPIHRSDIRADGNIPNNSKYSGVSLQTVIIYLFIIMVTIDVAFFSL